MPEGSVAAAVVEPKACFFQWNVTWDVASIAVAGVILIAIILYRAVSQDVTIDESNAYLMFVARNTPIFWLSGSANHLLNTILMKISVGSFGVSPFTLRLPAFIGGIIFTCSCALLCIRGLSGPFHRLLGFLLLGFNPLLVEYLIPARGYSLALAFQMAALVMLLRDIQEDFKSGSGPVAVASVLGALAVTANYTFLSSMAALLGVHATYRWWRGANRSATTLLLSALAVAVPFLSVIAFICADNIARMPQLEVTIGWATPSFEKMLYGIINLTFLSANPYVTPPHLVPIVDTIGRFGPWIVAGVVVLAAAALIVEVISRSSASQRSPEQSFFELSAICGVAVVFAMAALLVVFYATGIGLPRTRTALHFVPLLTIAVLGLVFACAGRPSIRMAYITSFAALSVLAFGFLGSVRLSYFREWIWNADICSMIERADTYASEHGIKHIETPWDFTSAGNFYRALLGAKFEALTDDGPREPAAGQELYFLPDRLGYAHLLEKYGLTVIAYWPLSKAIMAARLPPGSPQPENVIDAGWTRSPRGCFLHGGPDTRYPNYPIPQWERPGGWSGG